MLTKETHELTSALLTQHKVMRFILAVYHMLTSIRPELLYFCFEDKDSITLFTVRSTRQNYHAQETCIDKKDNEKSKPAVFTTYEKTNDNLDMLLSKLKDLYITYSGKLTRHSSWIPLFRGAFSKNDRDVIARVFHTQQKKKPNTDNMNTYLK